jgi:cell wall assembly regulator SMI1
VDIAVEMSWRRVTAWLAQHAPVTAGAIRSPAGAAELHRTQEAVAAGHRLPADLLAWWRLMDGVEEADERAGFPIPFGYIPLPLHEVRDWHASLSRFADAQCCRADGVHTTAAGEPTFGYCTATVPICRELGGGVLVVDLRDGADHGCVMNWYAVEGYWATGWTGVAAMLADVADRMHDWNGVEVVDGGVVQWGPGR